MRFSTFAIIAIAVPPTVEAFGVPRHCTSRKQASPVLAASDPYDFSLSTEGNKPKSVKKNKATNQPIPDPESKPELEAKPKPKPESEPLNPKMEKKTQKMKKEKSPEPILDEKKPEPDPQSSISIKKEKKSKKEVVEVKSAPVLEAPGPNEKVTKDVNAITTGVALGTAPLVVAPMIALTVARSTLSKTKERRDEIAAEIAAFEASEGKRLAKKSSDVDVPTLAKAIAFLGAGGASIGLILAAPFSNGNIPEVNKVPSVPGGNIYPREYAFSASAKNSKIETSPKTFIGSPKKSTSPDGYNFELSPEALKIGKPSVNSKKGDLVAKAKEESATKALAKAKEKEEAVAKAAVEKAATAENAAVAKAKGKEEAAAKATAEKTAAENAAVAKAKEKEEASAMAAAEKAVAEKAAVAKAKEKEEAAAKAAAEKVVAEKAALAKAKEKEEAAAKAVAEKAAAKITSDTQEKEQADSANANAENIVRKNAAPVGVVKGGEKGGKVLPREEISAETLDFLQKYKK